MQTQTPSEDSAEKVSERPRAETLSERFKHGVWIAEAWSVWPMFLLSILFVVISTIYLVAPSDLTGPEFVLAASLIGVIWVIFIADYVVRLVAADNKAKFFKSNLLELLTVILPFLRPLLILIYIWRLPVTDATAGGFFRTRFQLTVIAVAVSFLYFISTLVWLVERSVPHSNIKNWGDSMWWGISTLTTVGYGDFVPVTTTGRLWGSLLMVGGIFIVGVISASVISSFSDQLESIAKKHAAEAQEKWQRAKQIGPVPHYPKWALRKEHRDLIKYGNSGEEGNSNQKESDLQNERRQPDENQTG